MTAFGLGDVWARLYVPAPPGAPACEGASPHLFDLVPQELAAMARNETLGRPRPLAIAAQVDVALRYCAACPLAVREWCVEAATRPRDSRASIIAGGKVFSRGRVVWDLQRQAAAERAA